MLLVCYLYYSTFIFKYKQPQKLVSYIPVKDKMSVISQIVPFRFRYQKYNTLFNIKIYNKYIGYIYELYKRRHPFNRRETKRFF